jgi:LysM repeat protein
MTSLTPALSARTKAQIPRSRAHQGQLTGGYTVLIYALTRPAQITALLGEAGGRITAGYGKWEEVAVPFGVPFTQWTGRSLWGMDLDLVLDGWSKQRSVERDIASVEALAVRPGTQRPGQPIVTPPPIRIVGAVPHPEFTWVVTGIDWGDCLRSFTTGQRLRQLVTLHLLEYVEETAVAALKQAPPAPRKVRVVKGDNLKKLATKHLGKSSRWPDIAKLNKGMRGWKLPSKWIGKTIRVPAN